MDHCWLLFAPLSTPGSSSLGELAIMGVMGFP